MSFATPAVVPVMALGPLPDLITKWIGNTSGLMQIISETLTPNYIQTVIPVFSGKGFGHFTLVNPSALIVGGRQVCCDRCKTENLVPEQENTGPTSRWIIVCNACDRQTSHEFQWEEDLIIDERDKDAITQVPGVKFLRTPYPVPLSRLVWQPKESTSTNPSKDSSTGLSPLSLKVEEQTNGKRARQDSDPSSGNLSAGPARGRDSRTVHRKRSRNCE